MKWAEVGIGDRVRVAGRWYAVTGLEADISDRVYVQARSEVTGDTGTFKRSPTDEVECDRARPGAIRVDLGAVVESDTIRLKDGWHVVHTVSRDGDMVRIKATSEATGRDVLHVGAATGEFECERGATGEVVDLFQVIFSGQYRPTEIATKGVGPMLEAKTESEDEE